MPVSDLIACAPFRLDTPRPLTPYEWAIVQVAMTDYVGAASKAVVQAMQASPCASWRTSAFGPAPAVNLTWYLALAKWLAQLNPGSLAAAMQDMPKGLLCAQSPPWAPFAQGVPLSWEGSPQNELNRVPILHGAEPCAGSRQRSCYVPMTGAQVIAAAKVFLGAGAAGSGMPPQLAQMLQAMPVPPDFAARTFLFGLELARPGEPSKLGVKNAVLVWAPGQGADITGILRTDGSVDIGQVIALLSAMAPSIMPQLLPGLLQGLPPGLVPPWLQGAMQQMPPGAAAQLPQVLGSLTQVLGSVMNGGGAGAQKLVADAGVRGPHVGTDPQTPSNTGVPVVDQPGGVIAKTWGSWSDGTKAWVVAGAAVALVLLAVAVTRR